ncbi:MAG: hypothetical protein OHK0022_22440 [Roseiflexaceae bacterium]
MAYVFAQIEKSAMRTTNLSRRSRLPDNTFLLYWSNWEFIKGVSGRLLGPYEKLLLYGGLASLVLVGVIALMVYEWNDQQRWREQVVQVPGVVIAVEDAPKLKLEITYAYTATVQGRPTLISDTQRLDTELYGRPKPGDAVAVRYLPDTPSNSMITPRDPWELMAPLLALLFIGASGPLLIAGAGRRLWLLRREGWIIAGVVTAVDLTPSSNTKQLLRIDYRFTAPGGLQLRDRVSHEIGGLWGDTRVEAPTPGQAVAVLYVSPKLYQLL